MDLSTLLEAPLLSALAVPLLGGAAWVGRVHQRVNRTEADVKQFTDGLTAHIAADAVAHQRIAKMEGQLESALGILERLDARQ